METSNKNLINQIKPYKIVYPIFIGFVVVAFMMYEEFDINAFKQIEFTLISFFWLFVAFMLMLMRDIGYIIRIKILSNNRLTWVQATRIIILWEFTSAVTPSAIGGTSLAILFVNREGIKVGRSSAMVMATSFLDELYFILMFPILLITVDLARLWDIAGVSTEISTSIIWLAAIGYSIKFIYLIILSYGIFFNPRGLKYLLIQCFKLRLLKKWRYDINEIGTDIIRNSKELHCKSFMFWFKTFGATFLSWTSRYFVVNAILMSFWATNYDWNAQFLIFARQLIMWIMMLVSPTPGGSGFAEFVFGEYLGEFLPSTGVVVAVAMLWRVFTYYPYLLFGAITVPRWIKKSFKKKKEC